MCADRGVIVDDRIIEMLPFHQPQHHPDYASGVAFVTIGDGHHHVRSGGGGP